MTQPRSPFLPGGPMWTSPPNHDEASWDEPGAQWHCVVAGGKRGIEFGDRRDSLRLAVEPVGEDALPGVAETYVRGDQWHAWLPEGEGKYSLKFALRVIESTATRWVVEPTFSIQTSLLDTHPTLDLHVPGEVSSSASPVASGCPAITTVALPRGAGQVAILLDQTDAPFTANLSTATDCRLRLFGEFLEKGVIRKARPWVILDRSPEGLPAADAREFLQRLAATPLPLTP